MRLRFRLGALMMTLLLGLSACAGAQSASGLDAKYRARYAALTEFSGQCTVTADYGSAVYEYAVAISGDLTQGETTVTAPENIAGISFRWTDEDGTLVYDGVTLETGELSPDGLSPADAVPMILNALATGQQLSTGEQKLNGEEVLFLELANPETAAEENHVLCWLSCGDGALRRAEVTGSGRTVVTLIFSDFSYTYDTQKIEG